MDLSLVMAWVAAAFAGIAALIALWQGNSAARSADYAKRQAGYAHKSTEIAQQTLGRALKQDKERVRSEQIAALRQWLDAVAGLADYFENKARAIESVMRGGPIEEISINPSRDALVRASIVVREQLEGHRANDTMLETFAFLMEQMEFPDPATTSPPEAVSAYRNIGNSIRDRLGMIIQDIHEMLNHPRG